jgi:hypothetical protein
MADERPPQKWIGQQVNVVLRDRKPQKQGRIGGADFDSNSGTLTDANDLGVTLELTDGTLTFIPWQAIRRVTLLQR